MLGADEREPAPDALHAHGTNLGRRGLKHALARAQRARPASGATLLIYHRVGGGTRDELDVPTSDFARHLALLEGHEVVSLDAALDRLDAGDTRPSVVLTFDDGFDDVHANAWPLLHERGLPFTVYLASGYVGRTMVWEGSTARGAAGRGMSWVQLEEMLASGLCTIGNHTHTHVRPEELTEDDVDACTDAVDRHLGVRPAHFTYPWGVPVPRMEPTLRTRFRSVSTGVLGRNLPDADQARLARVPVRRSDPEPFFAAKLVGDLGPERAYAGVVRLGKAAGLRG
jgi:peptidoglycan/xylan/chitin deacetylase (PgdA/CDA1 family)